MVRVEYVKEGSRFRITWHGNSESREIEQFLDAAWEPAPGDVATRFPVRVYSQKQIFHLAGDAGALLKIVDEARPVNRREWQEGFDETSARFLAVRARARELESALSREGRIRGEIDDATRRIELFESSDYAAVFREHRTRLQQRHAVDELTAHWDAALALLRSAAGSQLPDVLSRNTFDRDSPEFGELEAASRELRLAALDLRARVGEASEALAELLAQWRRTITESAWSGMAARAQQARDEVADRLTGEGIESTREHAQLLERKTVLEADLAQLESSKAEVERLRTEGAQLLAELHDQRRALTARRREFLETVLADNSFVRVHVIPYGAMETVEAEFRQLIGREDQNFPRYVGRPATDGLLASLGTQLHRPPRTETQLQELKSSVRELASGRGDRTTYSDSRFTRHLEELAPEALDRLDYWFPEDSLSVTYSRGGTGRDFVSIGQASPGQKTATLLAFLLSYGTDPMILDQPEDDLDNRLISDLIVTQLRGIKSKRQMIVVTHNPNVVVNGDAEVVISLEAGDHGTAIEAHGCLQDPAIRDVVCKVMEGGREAFEARYRRITLRA